MVNTVVNNGGGSASHVAKGSLSAEGFDAGLAQAVQPLDAHGGGSRRPSVLSCSHSGQLSGQHLEQLDHSSHSHAQSLSHLGGLPVSHASSQSRTHSSSHAASLSLSMSTAPLIVSPDLSPLSATASHHSSNIFALPAYPSSHPTHSNPSQNPSPAQHHPNHHHSLNQHQQQRQPQQQHHHQDPSHTQGPFDLGHNLYPEHSFGLHTIFENAKAPQASFASLTTPTSPFYTQNVYSMAGEVKSRPRNLSLSESDREGIKPSRKNSLNVVEPDTKTTPSSNPDSNPRKRPSIEPVDYPRRRATIAVCSIQFSPIHCPPVI